MKPLLSSILISLLLVAPAFGRQDQEKTKQPPRPQVPQIEDGRNGQVQPFEELVRVLGQSDVVFLGEQHNNDSGHAFQMDVIKALHKNGQSIAISMEQFERDVQGVLNDYLRGAVDEEEFLKSSRPWKNYHEHYRPIVEFAKSNQIPVIAANIPRRIASNVSSGRELGSLDHPYLPRTSTTPKDAYWFKFQATMQGHLGADGETKLERFYASQCLKDDAMAEAITDFVAVNSHTPKIVVHLCGHFHSDFGLGTVSRVVSRRPLIRTTVVTMEPMQTEDGRKLPHSNQSELLGRAHFIFRSVQNSKSKSSEKDGESKTVKN